MGIYFVQRQKGKGSPWPLLFGFALLVFTTQNASAEDNPNPSTATEKGEHKEQGTNPEETLQQALEKEKQKNEAQEEKIQTQTQAMESQQAEIDELKAQMATISATLDKQSDDFEDDFDEAMIDEDETGKYLQISGFFDVTLHKNITEDDSFFKGYFPDSLTFLVQHINLYFASQISDTVKALIELRFSFYPHGKMLSMETDNQSYERLDSSVSEDHSGETITFGGVKVERAQLTWEPLDFLGVTAGRFLTPFGIWNVEHGTPILLPVRYPYIQLNEAMPLAQTGLFIHGRVFPSENTMLYYALTLSNGRGPIEQVYDLDNNKGLGLRLKFAYDGPSFDISLGGYGYMGKSTDAKTRMEFTVFYQEVTEDFQEYAGSLDLLMEFFGVRFQAEFVRSMLMYDTRAMQSPFEAPYVTGYPADHIKTYFYGLLGYALPLAQWLGDVEIVPYFMYEYSLENDLVPRTAKVHIFTGGITVRPTAAIALKVQGWGLLFPDFTVFGTPKDEWVYGVAGQVAVAF